MIDQLLDTIKEEVDNYLKVKMKNNKEQYIKLVPVVDQDGKPAVVEKSTCPTASTRNITTARFNITINR
jgi:hypothetical protein